MKTGEGDLNEKKRNGREAFEVAEMLKVAC